MVIFNLSNNDNLLVGGSDTTLWDLRDPDDEGKYTTQRPDNLNVDLGVTATGKDLKEARSKAYQATEWISFDNKYMRHDIGKAIDEA